ncbi:MAG: class I SAM-dependent methyltransferase, partial [Candidatus Norongarragalinales archaeon]
MVGVGDFEVKRANIRHHDAEAEIFERVHPEGSSIYERAKVADSIAFIANNSGHRRLGIDVGCGTGFVTSFMLPFYEMVVAADISRGMVEVAKRRLKGACSLNFVICDAEHLPFRNGVADFVSVSSVLH